MVTYTLRASNTGLQPLTGLAMNHTLPAGLTFENWVDANGAAYSNGAITWAIANLASGGQQAASFTARISSGAQYQGQNIVSAAALSGPGGISAAGQARISVNGPTTPVTDSVTTAPDTPVTLWPLGNDENPDGSPLLITGLGTPAHGAASIAGDRVIYTPTQGFQGNDSFTYIVQDGEFSAVGVIEVRVAALAFLSVFKTVEGAGQSGAAFLPDVAQGSVVTCTLSFFNGSGGEVAQNAVLTDVLPAGVQFTSWITQAGATLNGATITWSAASVPTNTVTAISFRAVVTGAVGSTVENVVAVAAANGDPVQASAALNLIGAPTPETRAVFLPLVTANASAPTSAALDEIGAPEPAPDLPEAAPLDTPEATPAAPEAAPMDTPEATPAAPEATPAAPEATPAVSDGAVQTIFLPVVQQ